MKHSLATTVALGLLLASAAGCSFVQPPRQLVSIDASAPDALIFVNGRPVGTGTATVELERDRIQEIVAYAPDGRVGHATLGTRVSSAGIVDLVLGTVAPLPFFFGLPPAGSRTLAVEGALIGRPPPPVAASPLSHGGTNGFAPYDLDVGRPAEP